MANVKKGQIVHVPSLVGWNKHLRAVGKRMFWKAERKVAADAKGQTAD